MRISIQAHLQYAVTEAASLLLQIEAAQDETQTIETTALDVTTPVTWNTIPGDDGVGQRRWGVIDGMFECTYQARVRVERPVVPLSTLHASPIANLPGHVTPYLMPSRYCHPEAFFTFVPTQFGDASGGDLVAKMSDWIENGFAYDNGASTGTTTATDSFHARAGVCRDYAHVLIAMARSVGIPARMASVYGPDVDPQDFHAVTEVFLEGAWHLVDPTGMAQPAEMVRIGVGRDAAEVSFMTSYGQMDLRTQSVSVKEVA